MRGSCGSVRLVPTISLAALDEDYAFADALDGQPC
jgi:hypothetical protein